LLFVYDDITYTYFHEVDPLYPQKAMDVINDLVAENCELSTVLVEERNAQYWIQQEDMVVDTSVRAYVAHIKSRPEVAYAVVIVLVALLISVYFCYVL